MFYWQQVGIFLILSVFSVFSYSKENQCQIVFDAGSSGTRIYALNSPTTL